MAFSDHLSYMTPTRSSARGVRRPLTMTGRDCAGDYFASSTDFEYDLFLHGLVTCDSALPSFSSSCGSSAVGGGAGAAAAAATISSSSSSASSSSFSTSGFFSRYRASRPVSTASPSASSTRRQQQHSSGHRSNQSLLTASSITSLNRSSAYEQQPFYSYYHQPSDDSHYQTVSRPSFFGGGGGFGSEHHQQQQHQQQAGICSQQHRMKNVLASNLSLGSSVPMNTATAVASFRPNMLEEMGSVAGGHMGRSREKQKAALKQTADAQLDPSSENVDNLSHQQLHALHRFRRQKKKGLIGTFGNNDCFANYYFCLLTSGFLCRLRDVVISFTPKARMSIVNRPDLFVRFGLQEKEALACFDYLDKECSGGPQAVTGGPAEDVADAAETLVTTDDLLAEWKMMEKEMEKKAKEEMKSSVDAATITATTVPPQSCDTTLTTPLTSSPSITTTCSTAAMIKEVESERCLTTATESVIDKADSSISSIDSDYKSLEDNGHSLSSAMPLAADDDNSSVLAVSRTGKASKKKSKQKKAKVGKSR